MDDDPEISSWMNKIISSQKEKASPIDFSDEQEKKEANIFELDDLSDNNEIDLNFFKKYKNKNMQPDESDDDNSDDVDISHFFHMNNPIEIDNGIDVLDKNQSPASSDNIDTLNEARRLLSSWADQTESFQNQNKPANSNHQNNYNNNRNNSSPNRVVQYRKLEMPMMVAKKAPELKVNDPTLKMEERLKHVREMREKRLEKQKLKQIQSNTPQRDNIRPRIALKVPVPDIDSEIRNYRSKMNENIKEKQKEIEQRERRMKRIEEGAFLNVQSEFNESDKKKSSIQIDKKIDRSKINIQSSVSTNKKKVLLNQNKNNLQDTNIRKKDINNASSNNLKLNNQNGTNNINSQNKDDDQNDSNDERVIQMRLQVFIKNEIIRQKRYFFAKWIDRCRFQTQTFKKAAVLANFRILSRSFSLWNQRLHSIQQKRELDQLETKLRERKSKDQLIQNHFKKNRIRKFFSIWRIKYKTQIEFQIAEARKKKRLEIVALQLNNSNNNNRNKNLNQNQKSNQDHVRRITVRHSTQPSHHFNKQQNQDLDDLIVTNSNQARPSEQNQQIKNSPSNSPNRGNVHNPPKKVKKIKIDPKIEAMEKRSEEQKQKRLEKLQKKAEEERELREKKIKEEEEKLKKKRIEHLKELEKEKKIREDERKKQIETEKAKERLKYITDTSEKFRTKMVKLNAFREWKKIINIKKNFVKMAVNFHSKKLKQKVFLSFQLNVNMEEKERFLIANKFYTKHLKLNYFNHWFSIHEEIKSKELKAFQLHQKMLLKSSLNKMKVVRKERKKKRFMEIQNALRLETMRRVFKAWTVGCAAIREDEEREEERNNLLSKALKYLDEISSDDI